jgi:protein SCO1/2
MKHTFFYLSIALSLFSCQQNHDKLPVYGNKTAFTRTVNGSTVIDSLDYTISDFTFLDQDSLLIDAKAVTGKIWVVDFFFTACPSICPKMKKEMLRLYNKYEADTNVVLLSFSIDPKRDSVARLHAYAGKLGIDKAAKWHLLTGEKDSIYSVAERFLVSAEEDPDAPGGHVHSGNFILVDKQRRLRGYYDGVKTESVDQLLLDLDVLLKD